MLKPHPTDTAHKGAGKRASDGEGTQPSKRRKQDLRSSRDDVPPPGKGILPSDAPRWLTSASGMLRSEALGPEWAELVGVWESFEVAAGFSTPAKLAATGRPPCIADWIQRARAPTYRPAIPDLGDFARNFTAWWASLQPEWRRSTAASLSRKAGDYESIRKPGVNGLLSAIAALFFWGSARESNGPDGWLQAVDEVDWAIRQLANVHE